MEALLVDKSRQERFDPFGSPFLDRVRRCMGDQGKLQRQRICDS